MLTIVEVDGVSATVVRLGIAITGCTEVGKDKEGRTEGESGRNRGEDGRDK